MTRNYIFRIQTLLVVLILALTSCSKDEQQHNASGREIITLNENWKFSKEAHAYQVPWEKVNIPHTPQIEPLVVNDQWQGTCFYEKEISLKNDNKKTILLFDGVMQETKVFFNNKLIKEHIGGYLPFAVDLTPYIGQAESNKIRVVVNNEDNLSIPPGKSLETLDFNIYGGIYRNVSLIRKNKIHISNEILANKAASGGIIVHFDKVTKKLASGTIRIHVNNESDASKEIMVKSTLTDKQGKEIVFNSSAKVLDQKTSHSFVVNVDIEDPLLWSTAEPNLYTLTNTVIVDDRPVDSKDRNVGIRSIKLTPEGFYLNGKKTYIRGTNRHQEYPYVGYAIPENADYRDAVKIKQAGFDFVRLSHYPHSNAFLNACDELGILVMDAIPGWQFIGDSLFMENSYQDIRDMARRDRNHPSIIFWEVSLNESGMPEEYMKKANAVLKEEIPFDDTYTAGWIDHPSYDLYIPARQHGKAPDYWNNYKTDERPIFIAEYGDWEYYAQNAGFNQTAFQGLKKEERTSRQLRKHGENRLLQQALNYQEAANSNRKGKNAIGDANWLMFDYNRGYADDIESSGISDIFRIPKFAFYFYQSQRPPYDTMALTDGTGPMVKLATYWTLKSSPKVKVYSNCEEIALFLNDKLVSKQKPLNDKYSSHLPYPPFVFDLKKFKSGKLKAVGYIDGKAVADDIVLTPKELIQIQLKIDTSTRPVAANDLVFVYAEVTDENNMIIPDYTGEITFEAEGAHLIGENPVHAEAGIASILLKTENATKVKIKASAQNLKSAMATVR